MTIAEYKSYCEQRSAELLPCPYCEFSELRIHISSARGPYSAEIQHRKGPCDSRFTVGGSGNGRYTKRPVDWLVELWNRVAQQGKQE